MHVRLFGYNWIGCYVLQYLVELGYDVDVITHAAEPHTPSLERFARKLGIVAKLSPDDLNGDCDLVLSIYYRKKIENKIISSARMGAYNLHPSILPMYKGCSSLTWAMINGESEAGFTYHSMTEEFDAGNIILQETFPIFEFDHQKHLYERAMVQASKAFPKFLQLVQDGYNGKPQTDGGSYYPRGAPYSGELKENWSSREKDLFVRAMIHAPYPPAKLHGSAMFESDLDD